MADSTLSPSESMDERPVSSSALESMGVKFMEQDSLERQVAESADKAILSRELEIEEKRLSKTKDKYNKVITKIRSLEAKISSGSTRISEKQALKEEVRNLMRTEKIPLEKDIMEIRERLDGLRANKNEADKQNQNQEDSSSSSVHQLPSETREEFLIRTGQITAFGTSNGFIQEKSNNNSHTLSHQDLLMPGIVDLDSDTEEIEDKVQEKSANQNGQDEEANEILELQSEDEAIDVDADSEEEYEDPEVQSDSDIEVIEDNDDLDDIIDDIDTVVKPSTKSKEDPFLNIDDGDETIYQTRLNKWIRKRSELRKKLQPDYVDDPTIPEYMKPHPVESDAILNDEFKVPGDIYPSLFDYQKTCVQWLWELYIQKTGGIIGDEMGLGKTIQIISFIASLHYSGKLDKPVLIVCPATVMRQWCNEFHKWWPALRTVILHSIGNGMSAKASKKKKRSYDDFEEEDEDSWEEVLASGDGAKRSSASLQTEKNAKELIERITTLGGVIITTYIGVRIYSKYLLKQNWGYVVLDEGHKIRNPDGYVTLSCKQLKTPNRIILSGTPIQNNLVELWSLFDFVFPGRLGTLPVFQSQFCVPINLGGYANATNVQVQTGYKCAVILRDLISPYLLRRVKADVAKDLPKKTEMVLFCSLTTYQRNLYEKFLASEDLSKILNHKRNALYGIDILRKICNHPDLVDVSTKGKLKADGSKTTIEERSGKMPVVHTLLDLWLKEGHKCLIFTQTKQMLNILQEFLDFVNSDKPSKEKMNYLRMDGSTNISVRQSLVDTFNNDPQYNVFLLTTRVGGLGVNLTGASRVIIYDPDWNPSTDLQARERAWRLGQKKDVAIYRLMIAGSIEEKIYHRQIFKQFLTNKILKDPKQKRFFKMNDLHDLFSLGDQDSAGTETADLFGAKEVNFSKSKPRETKFSSRGRQAESSGNNGTEDDFMEVSRIKGVNDLQEFKYGNEDNQSKDGGSSTESDDFMSGIFSKTGVHSALQHDAIMSSGSIDAGGGIIDQEATRIANEAVKALRESRKETRKAKSGTPTWTGRFGKAGRKVETNNRVAPILRREMGLMPSSSRGTPSGSSSRSVSPMPSYGSKPVLSSSSILANMKKRKITDTSSSNNTNIASSNGKGLEEKELIIRLSDYMASLDGFFSKSESILDALKINLNNEKTVKTVRSMLKSICTWDKVRKGWILNEEFR